jgi:hypothetical protein
MASSFLKFLEHTHTHTYTHTLARARGRTPLDEWSARHRDLYLTTHDNHNRQTSMRLGGIRTNNPNMRAAVDLCLRPRRHWMRRWFLFLPLNILSANDFPFFREETMFRTKWDVHLRKRALICHINLLLGAFHRVSHCIEGPTVQRAWNSISFYRTAPKNVTNLSRRYLLYIYIYITFRSSIYLENWITIPALRQVQAKI